MSFEHLLILEDYSGILSRGFRNLLLILQYTIPITPTTKAAIYTQIEVVLYKSRFMNPIIAPINRGIPVTKYRID